MTLVLFGSNNPTGAAFLNICSDNPPEIWGRRSSESSKESHIYCDLSMIPQKPMRSIRGVLISFAPIWLLAPFLSHLAREQPEVLQDLKGVIACSSSSFITKQFAFNEYDRGLSVQLKQSHKMIRAICIELNIPFQILAPTLVYGEVNGYSDKNISKIIKLLRTLPVIFLPKTTGLRQPIHATQLALIAFQQASKMLSGCWSRDEPQVVTLGGDSIITYEDMIIRIKDALQANDLAKNCQILTIPDRIFFLIISPLLPMNPKLFEALMRIKTNLSDFTEAYKILGEAPKAFPILPLGTGS
jgi:hypothetical protein